MQAHWLDTNEPINVDSLRSEGVMYEQFPTEPDQYLPALSQLKERRGYVEQDEVALSPQLENLEAICAKFIDEHSHTEDEVRFVLEGEGIFDIRSLADEWMRVKVEPGDLLVVPEGRHHRFMLTDQKAIRCVRLFKDQSGWVANYRA